MDDKDPQGPGEPGPGRAHGRGDGRPPRLRSRGRSEVLPPLPTARGQSPGLSTSLPIPARSSSSGENTIQSVFTDADPRLRSQGFGEALPPNPFPSSASASTPEGAGADFRGEKSKQSVSKDGAPPPLSRGRSEGCPPLPPFPPSPGQSGGLSVSLPIEERDDSGGEKTKQPDIRDEKVSHGHGLVYYGNLSKCVKGSDDLMELSEDNTDHVEGPLGVRKRKCSVEDFGAVMVRTTKQQPKLVLCYT